MDDVVTSPYWETKSLSEMSRTEWEALCDGCGKCCLLKVEDEDTGDVAATNIACRLLDTETARCSNYRHRRAFVPDCIRLDSDNLEAFYWLPQTCAYRLVAEGKPLADWHPLISGSPDTVHQAGISVAGWVVSEDDAGPIEHHLIDREL